MLLRLRRRALSSGQFVAVLTVDGYELAHAVFSHCPCPCCNGVLAVDGLWYAPSTMLYITAADTRTAGEILLERLEQAARKRGFGITVQVGDREPAKQNLLRKRGYMCLAALGTKQGSMMLVFEKD